MTGDKPIVIDDMYLAPESETRARAEAAMPGTDTLAPILTLVPPPVDPDLVMHGDEEEESERDYGPDPVAEFSVCALARSVFAPGTFAAAVTPAMRKLFALPTFYVRTPGGGVTYMESSDAPTEAVALIVGWSLRDEERRPADQIVAGADELARWLANRPEGFDLWRLDRAALDQQQALARRILAVAPGEASVSIFPRHEGRRFDGKKVWRTLHAIGLQWGDGDQFHWSDPTRQTDYLFSATVDDGDLGYALPEEIAAGRQHFDVIRFGFEIARTPHPAHVLGQMIRAAEAAASELDAQMVALVDAGAADGPNDLARAVETVVRALSACGVKPGSQSVCMLR